MTYIGKYSITNFLKSIAGVINQNLTLFISIVIPLIIVLVLLAVIVFRLGRHMGLIEGKNLRDQLVKTAREDAVKRSRAIIGGQISEQIAPFLPDFPCAADDVRFIGKPVDFIGFSGLGSDSTVNEILFIEVKTGSSALSGREKEIQKAIEEGRVRYVEYRI